MVALCLGMGRGKRAAQVGRAASVPGASASPRPTERAPSVYDDGVFVGPSLPDQNSRERKLLSGLLAYGGTRIVSRPEPDLEQIFARGELLEGEPSHLRLLRVIRCHSNSASLWEAGQSPEVRPRYLRGCELMTGYALSEDGYWRQHSWCLSAVGRVIETTVRRQRYYGFRLSFEEALDFAAANQ